MTSVTLPESVTKIGSRAFYGCTGLTGVTIPEGVTKIGECAFAGCAGLTRATVPESVELDRSVFRDCPGLREPGLPEKEAAMDKQHTETAGEDPVVYTSLTSVTISEGVTKIGGRAFKGCAGITSITIPEGVTVIGCQAFSGCMGLERIVFPASIEEIAADAFEDCPKLILCAPDGSAAMKYAAERKLRFQAL